MPKVLITGCNGFIGRELLNKISASDLYSVVATSRSLDTNPNSGDYTFELLDITDKPKVQYLFSRYTPDIVVNSAAMASVDACEENKVSAWNVNVEGVKILVDECERYSAKLVQLSTDFVFEGARKDYKENDETNPVNYYGLCKKAAEVYIIQNSTSWNIVRTILVYGYSASLVRDNILTWVLKSLKQKKSIKVVNDQYRMPTFIDDLVCGLESILNHNDSGIYHLSGLEYLSVFDFCLKIADIFDLDTSLIQPISSVDLNQIGKRPFSTGFNLQKAIHEINYTPVNIHNTLLQLKRRVAL